jgi:hypothetical protein
LFYHNSDFWIQAGGGLVSVAAVAWRVVVVVVVSESKKR